MIILFQLKRDSSNRAYFSHVDGYRLSATIEEWFLDIIWHKRDWFATRGDYYKPLFEEELESELLSRYQLSPNREVALNMLYEIQNNDNIWFSVNAV